MLIENTVGGPESLGYDLGDGQMRCSLAFSIADREHLIISIDAFPEEYTGRKHLHSIGMTYDGAVFELVKP